MDAIKYNNIHFNAVSKNDYSRVVKYNGKLFRYNYNHGMVEYVMKVTNEVLTENEEWIKQFGEPLFEVRNGYVVIDEVGLYHENWDNIESRESYLSLYCDDLDEELAYLIDLE